MELLIFLGLVAIIMCLAAALNGQTNLPENEQHICTLCRDNDMNPGFCDGPPDGYVCYSDVPVDAQKLIFRKERREDTND